LLQFFANPVCDSLGNGEGQIYLGDKMVTTTNCDVGFTASFGMSTPVGYAVTSTAIDASNNTSEFSACAPVQAVPGLKIDLVSNQQVSLAWTNAPTSFTLKQAESLSPPIQWTSVTNNSVTAMARSKSRSPL